LVVGSPSRKRLYQSNEKHDSGSGGSQATPRFSCDAASFAASWQTIAKHFVLAALAQTDQPFGLQTTLTATN